MKQINNGQLVRRSPQAALTALFGVVLIVLTACGTPGMTVSLQTVPVGGVTLATPTAQSSNAVANQPTQPQPTAVAAVPATDSASGAPTKSAPAAAPSDGFVLIWVLFGTPTPNGAQPAKAPVTVPTTVPTTAPTTVTKVAQSPTRAPTLSPTATGAGGAAPVAFKGDVNRGKSLFGGAAGCSACHDVTAGIVMVGPSLKGVASRAGTRKPGFSAIDYLRESIMKPNAFVVPGFVAGVMVQNYGTTLTPAQIDDIVAYLLTLR